MAPNAPRIFLIALITVAALVSLHGAAQAARPDTRKLTCQQAKLLVRERGAVVLTTGPRTFDRFTVNRLACPSGEIGWLTTAPTTDNPRCRVGYVCQQRVEPLFMERVRPGFLP